MSSYRYRKSHCGDKTIVRSSYLHNGISYAGKMTFLYWIRAMVPFYWHKFTLILIWINKYIYCYKVCDEITHPFPNVNYVTVEVWECISNFIPHLTMHVVNYPCCDWNWYLLVNGATERIIITCLGILSNITDIWFVQIHVIRFLLMVVSAHHRWHTVVRNSNVNYVIIALSACWDN